MYNNEFYKKLKKPKITPSSKVFQIAWGILYLFMIVSLLLILKQPPSVSKTLGILFFGIQLILNLLWSPIFFILENIVLAFAIAVLLTFCVGITILLFGKVLLISAVLLVPYFIWMLFACYLNFSFLQLND